MRNPVLLGKVSLKFWLMVIDFVQCKAYNVLIQHSNASGTSGMLKHRKSCIGKPIARQTTTSFKEKSIPPSVKTKLCEALNLFCAQDFNPI